MTTSVKVKQGNMGEKAKQSVSNPILSNIKSGIVDIQDEEKLQQKQ